MFLEKEGGVTESEMPRENEFPVFSYEETQSGISRLWDRSGVGIKNDEILEIRAVFNAFQTCPRPPSLREIISFFLRTFFL